MVRNTDPDPSPDPLVWYPVGSMNFNGLLKTYAYRFQLWL
jgi:hypothetical protein